MKLPAKVPATKSQMRRKVKGQTLVIVGLLISSGVLLGLVALAFDGGSALLQRRAMQNAADSGALGVAKKLAANVVIDQGQPKYAVSYQDLTTTVDQFFGRNQGGVTGQAVYNARLDYGTFNPSGPISYTFSTAATYDGSTWTYIDLDPSNCNNHQPSIPTQNCLVPSWVDAVRVQTGVDNPTTFGRAIGVNSVPVSAKAAAALSGVSDFTPSGPTWPMTGVASASPDPSAGICNPVLFWSNTVENFKNLIQLGADQGDTSEGGTSDAHLQLIKQYDLRDPLSDATQGNMNRVQCPPGQAVGLWSPKGGCSATNGLGTLGRFCCAAPQNNGPVDVANWITHDFTGRLSLTTTSWLDENGQSHDWRSSYDSNSHVPGDWPEVYNGGTFDNAVQQPVFDYINSPDHRQVDTFYSAYGYHVDKVIYRYDLAEIWAEATDPSCGHYPQDPCPMAWLSTTDPRVPNASSPGRVHLAQALVFRFYSQMASQTGFDTPAQYCGSSQSFSTSDSKVYGVFVGEEVRDPPPDARLQPHSTYNFVMPVDP